MSFFDEYLQYTEGNEAPKFFHRWAAISGIGAMLGRNFYFQHGHFQIYPNNYIMLMGTPGTRKSTAIKILKGLLRQAGYSTIAADRTSKEKFIADLASSDDDPESSDKILEQNLWGEDAAESQQPSECFIMADEFNDFIGTGNVEFASLLGNLWDYNDVYRYRIKTGKSLSIPYPTINILGGNTPTGFALAFPSDLLGQGFLSRLILVYGESSGRKITFPRAPSASDTQRLSEYLRAVRVRCSGAASLTPGAESLIDKIYTTWRGLDDYRFDSYTNRRLNHLIKVTLAFAASRLSTQVTETDVIHANTVLAHTEHLMPKALGEFGKARNSDVAHKVMMTLDGITKPMVMKDLWKAVHNDLESIGHLAEILKNLQHADKIIVANGGFLPKRKVLIEADSDTVDFSILTDEERIY